MKHLFLIGISLLLGSVSFAENKYFLTQSEIQKLNPSARVHYLIMRRSAIQFIERVGNRIEEWQNGEQVSKISLFVEEAYAARRKAGEDCIFAGHISKINGKGLCRVPHEQYCASGRGIKCHFETFGQDECVTDLQNASIRCGEISEQKRKEQADDVAVKNLIEKIKKGENVSGDADTAKKYAAEPMILATLLQKAPDDDALDKLAQRMETHCQTPEGKPRGEGVEKVECGALLTRLNALKQTKAALNGQAREQKKAEALQKAIERKDETLGEVPNAPTPAAVKAGARTAQCANYRLGMLDDQALCTMCPMEKQFLKGKNGAEGTISSKYMSLLSTVGRYCDGKWDERSTLKAAQAFGFCDDTQYSFEKRGDLPAVDQEMLALAGVIQRSQSGSLRNLFSSNEAAKQKFQEIWGISIEDAEKLFCNHSWDSNKMRQAFNQQADALKSKISPQLVSCLQQSRKNQVEKLNGAQKCLEFGRPSALNLGDEQTPLISAAIRHVKTDNKGSTSTCAYVTGASNDGTLIVNDTVSQASLLQKDLYTTNVARYSVTTPTINCPTAPASTRVQTAEVPAPQAQ